MEAEAEAVAEAFDWSDGVELFWRGRNLENNEGKVELHSFTVLLDDWIWHVWFPLRLIRSLACRASRDILIVGYWTSDFMTRHHCRSLQTQNTVRKDWKTALTIFWIGFGDYCHGFIVVSFWLFELWSWWSWWTQRCAFSSIVVVLLIGIFWNDRKGDKTIIEKMKNRSFFTCKTFRDVPSVSSGISWTAFGICLPLSAFLTTFNGIGASASTFPALKPNDVLPL